MPKDAPFRGPLVRPKLVLALFDGAGKVRPARAPAKVVGRNFLFRVHDLDGDGEDDVVFLDDNKLVATRGGLEQVLWEWPLPGPDAELFDVRPAGEHHRATVVLTVGSAVYGIDGKTGQSNTFPPVSIVLLSERAPTG